MLHAIPSPSSTPLRSGYTTGSCSAAAAKGAAQMLASQQQVDEVTIVLPGGICATFVLQGQTFTEEYAACFVIKDAGDDPDITNGAEIHARVERTPFDSAQIAADSQGEIILIGGIGIGTVTKPGLAIAPGEWAINPVPRTMIEQSVRSVFSSFPPHLSPITLTVEISIPDGEARATKTLNARLGIIGGLSILGTTGIVRPISAKAWTDTIDAALDVAKACGCRTVVLSTGRSSEMAAQKFLDEKKSGAGSQTHVSDSSDSPHSALTPLSEEAYIMMGDHVAYALQACMMRGFDQPIIACQFAKLLKIACGYENTHAAASGLDLSVLHRWAEAAHISPEYLVIIANANTAREIAVATGFDRELMELVSSRARQATAVHAPGIHVHPLLCGYEGTVVNQVPSA